MKISVIVTTYNNPHYLGLVLEGLIHQTDKNFEIIVADDGSTSETKELIENFSKSVKIPVFHAWQEDLGFRAAASRNNGARMSSGEYLIYLDGDCIPRKNFVEAHRRLAEKGYFVTGNRILLSESFSKDVVNDKAELPKDTFLGAIPSVLRGKINRNLPLLTLPDAIYNRKKDPVKWQTLRSCNFGVWKKDLEKVNGFNEDFIGWGFEDSELAVRLINSGVQRKSGNFATGVFHLYHKELKVPQEGKNWDALQNAIKNHLTTCSHGLKR